MRLFNDRIYPHYSFTNKPHYYQETTAQVMNILRLK